MIRRITHLIIILFTCNPVWAQKTIPDTIHLNVNSQFKIGFGSCFHQDKDYTIWNSVVSDSLDIWIWLGDNIYGDTGDKDSLEAKYNKLKLSREYSSLRNTTPIIGTWDDHDYGANDAGKELSTKEISQQACLNFMDVPIDSERWLHDGIYGSYILDSANLRIILLDLRYFKGDMNKKRSSILGKKQWKWLKSELKSSNEDYNIICSSLQVISNQHAWENWTKYGKQREKLLRIIKKFTPNNTIILSGDRHRGEISLLRNDKLTLYDITSSSLNAPGTCSKEINNKRVGKVICGVPNYGVIQYYPETNSLEVVLKNQLGIIQIWNLKTHKVGF